MRRLRLVRSFIVPFVTALAVVLAAGPVAAAPVLAAVRVDAQPSGSTTVSVSFTGGTPTYRLVGAGTPETAVLFDGATLGPQIAPSVAGAGAINSISIAQTGTSSSIALHLSSAVRVRVRPGGGSTFFIDVSAAGNATSSPAPQSSAVSSAIGIGPVTEVVLLKYADISEIAGVLVSSSSVATNDTFSPAQTQLGATSLGNNNGGFNGGGGGFQQPAQNFGGGFGNQGQANGLAQRVNDNIAVDRRLNAIVLSGTPEVIAGLRAVIEKLDVPVPSVMLETQIVELSDTATRNIGLDLSPDGSGVVVNANSPGGRSTGTGGTSSGGGLIIGTQQQASSGASLNALLYAQVAKGNGRVIAKPRILAQSGQPASILTGDAIPIFTNIAVQNVGTQSQVNYVNVGVNLQIQPRVSSDGFVTSHIYSEVSSVTGFTNNAPQISQRTASTIATVRDGESFIIGGLLQDNELRNLTKIPFVGDIPLIGIFFRHVNNTHSQTNLYIVVTPHVVNSSYATPPISPLVVPSPLPQVTAPPAPSR